MKRNLLIITQKVDIDDDLLGFMHGWILEFSKHCDKLTVICLQKGEYHLPENVKVLSLGKENINKNFNSKKMTIPVIPSLTGNPGFGEKNSKNQQRNLSLREDSADLSNLPAESSRSSGRDSAAAAKYSHSQFAIIVSIRRLALYFFNFYKYIWRERNNYDCVFVHMNKEYVLLGGFFWKIWRKKIMFWYNHRYGNQFAWAAMKIADPVFYASPYSYMAKFAKGRRMPAGIDTEKFKIENRKLKVQSQILYLGRISPVKNVDVLIKAVKLLDKKGADFVLNIVGEPGEKDKEYFIKIKDLVKDLEEKSKIKFWGNVPNSKTPEIYGQNDVFINLTNSGSLDKTTLEAMSCEIPAIVCNRSYENIFPPEWHSLLIFKENDEVDLAEKIINLAVLDDAKKKAIGAKSREIVIKNHGLNKLIAEFKSYI